MNKWIKQCMPKTIKYAKDLPLVMKLTFVVLMIGIMQVYAKVYTEDSKLNFSFKNVSIEEIFNEIENQSDYRFLYRNETIENKRVTLNAKNAGIDEVLSKALANADIEYTILENNLVVIKPSEKSKMYQGVTVSGRIISATDNSPLPGVNVVEKGTPNGTVSDLEGNYSITVTNSDAVLVFSFVGYLTEAVPVGDNTSINMNLSEDILELDQVIVIGYGTMRKSDLTGAVASVSEETLRSTVATNIDQALQGRIAGVQVMHNSGQPGGALTIRIRGATSITGTNEPLYVIDGIPFQGQGAEVSGFDWAGGANGQNRINPLSTINPNDIVRIEVLKDASASAIYGSQAANGVVLITTKTGEAGKAKVSYNTYFAHQSLPNRLDMLNLPQYSEYQNQISDELNQTPNEKYADPSLLGPGTDWQSEVFRNAWSQSHQISVTGGREKMDYAVTGSYFNQDGIIIGSGFERFTGRVNVNTQVKKWLKVGGVLNYAKTKDIITLNDGGDGVIMNALLMQPDIPVRNMDGDYAGPDVTYAGSNYNPVALALIRNNTLDRERIFGNIYASADIIKGLNFKTELAIDNNNSINIAFHPTYQFGAIKNDVNKMRQRNENSFFWIWRNYLTYDRTFAEKHKMTVLLGAEVQKSLWQRIEVTKENFATNEIHVLSQGDNTTNITNGWKDPSSKASYFGRIFYDYGNRYLATFILRADGSSKFGPENKWGYFPSASVAWRISNESFMQNVAFIRNLKLRLGYGMVGNHPNQSYLYGSSLTTKDSEFGTSYRMELIANPNLKWETTETYGIALETSLFTGRIDFIIDLYNKQTKDMLLRLSVPNYLGGLNPWEDVAAPYVNVGKMENKGVEISLTTHNLSKTKLTWTTNLIFSLNRNKVKELDEETKIYWEGLYWYPEFQRVTMTTAGQPIGVFYGYVMEEIFTDQQDILDHAVQVPDPESVTEENPNGTNLVNYNTGVWIGDIKFQDLNGDGLINTDDQAVIGDPNPDFTFGFNNSFNYGPFELSINLTGSYGADILNYSRVRIEGMTSLWSNQAATVDNRSKYRLLDPSGDPDDPANVVLANPGTDMPRFATNDVNRNNRMSTRFIEDGSYLRIQNIIFGYTLPATITQKVKIDRVRIYVNMQNVYTFTRYSGYDPEIGAFNQDARRQNFDMGRYPSPRIISFGLDIDF
ncbi:TonB-dependent receptor P3 [subsurface metagenome]